MTRSGYLPEVEYIRCFASLGVMIFHMGGKTLPVLNYGWLGVEMFFVLSGFIICYTLPAEYRRRGNAYLFVHYFFIIIVFKA
jgi:peptidoglycan/LPS O-acetylase OafA/YrhL